MSEAVFPCKLCNGHNLNVRRSGKTIIQLAIYFSDHQQTNGALISLSLEDAQELIFATQRLLDDIHYEMASESNE